MNRKSSNAGGFALIDLLFVIGIIGVLAVIALPRLLLAVCGGGRRVGDRLDARHQQRGTTFALTCGGGFYAPKLTTLGAAPAGSNEAFISPSLGSADTMTQFGLRHSVDSDVCGRSRSCNGLGFGEAGQAQSRRGPERTH